MTSSGERLAQILVVLWSLAAVELAGGQSITWHEPLPAKTVSSSGTDLTPAEIKVFEGYPASLSWSFSLTSVTLISATIRFDGDSLALSGPGGLGANVEDAFKDRFNFTWISQRITLVILNVTAADDESNGAFQCELSTNKGFWSRNIRVKIIERTKIVDVTSGQEVCEDTNVTLSCNATGKPEPNITWTRVWENGTDSGALQSKDGYFVMDDISISSNGTYRCTAFNGVGEPVNQTVKVIVQYSASEVRVNGSSNTVLEGDAYTLNCYANGDPEPSVTWIKVSNNQRSDGNVLNFFNISRNDAGNYACEANNSCGMETKTVAVNVSFKPDNVTLESNTTENNGCNDLWVNFTCNSSEANPPVQNYLLLKNESEVSFNQKGTWIEKISQGETFVYKCQAYQEIDNVSSTNNISLSVKEPLTMKQVKNEVVQEGGNVVQECNESAGTPPLTFFWKKVNTSEVWYGKLLNITDIRRNQSGEYRCFAHNTCGNDSSTMFIDVQFKPDNVTLEVNTTENNGCNDIWVNFTCHSSKANPPVHRYVLLKNEEEVIFSEKRTWIEKISRGETFVYKCQARQQIGNVTSANNVTATVNVPAVVEQIQNVTVQEGRNMIRECNVTEGFPPLTFVWKKVNTSEVWYKKLLNITDIRRNQSGEYRCFASNTCGNDSSTMFIDVQFKPDNVTLERNTTENNGCSDLWVNFTCNSSEASPPVHNYLLLKNETEVSFNQKGTWVEKISQGETFVYKCQAYQEINNVTSTNDITLIVNDPPAIQQVLNITVEEGGDVAKECNLTAGAPPPDVFWKNINTNEVIYGKLLNITSIRRNQSGEYRCFANNTCGSDSSTLFIDVQFRPKITYVMNDTTVNDTDKVTLVCRADGVPAPIIKWMFVNDSTDVPVSLKIIGKQSEGFYRCTAENIVGRVISTRDVYITVSQYRPWKPKLIINGGDSSVILNNTFTVTCDAQANPPASYEIHRDSSTIVGRNSVVTTSVAEVKEGRYEVIFTCKSYNAYGDGPNVTITLVVFAPPAINNTSSCIIYVKKRETKNLACSSAGHPKPNITWTLNGKVQQSDGDSLSFTPQETGAYPYKCKADNGIENSTEATVDVVVENQAGTLLIFSMTYLDKEFIPELNSDESAKYHDLEEAILKVREAFPECHTPILVVVIRFSPDEERRVVAFFHLTFHATMGAEASTSYLKDAAKKGKLGKVDSITNLEAVPDRKRCMAIFNDDQLCNSVKTVWIAVFSVGGVIIVVVIVLSAYYVHKKRKCRRKDNSVHNGNEEEQAFYSKHSTLSDGKPCDYAMSGPQPSVDLSNEQQLGAVPTYAVVDKSRKKDKKKKKEAAEQKPVDDQYAVVDKSKKKKKNEADNTYAEVDMLKKSKKKLQPGEILYADLGEFHQMKKMPEISTSPKALPPINRPEAYAETQYADIAQFIKGNRDDPSAEVPKDSTTPAAINTATASKEESSAGNTGNGAQETNETGF